MPGFLRCHGLQPARLLCPRNFPGKDNAVGASQGALVPAFLWGEPAVCTHSLSRLSLPPRPIPSLQVIRAPTPSSVLWRNSVRAGWHLRACVCKAQAAGAPQPAFPGCVLGPRSKHRRHTQPQASPGRRGKSPPASAEDAGSLPGWGRGPEGGNGNPVWGSVLGNPRSGALAWRSPSLGLWPGEPPVWGSGLEKPMGRGSLVGHSPRGWRESDVTACTHTWCLVWVQEWRWRHRLTSYLLNKRLAFI